VAVLSTHTLRSELALPPGGGVIGLGMNIVELTCGIGSGDNVKVTGALKFPNDCTVAVTLPHCPGRRTSVFGEIVIE